MMHAARKTPSGSTTSSAILPVKFLWSQLEEDAPPTPVLVDDSDVSAVCVPITLTVVTLKKSRRAKELVDRVQGSECDGSPLTPNRNGRTKHWAPKKRRQRTAMTRDCLWGSPDKRVCARASACQYRTCSSSSSAHNLNHRDCQWLIQLLNLRRAHWQCGRLTIDSITGTSLCYFST
jgi:hypothetical protein